jgi:hypothetical protein
MPVEMDEVERIAREIMGWIGCKPIRGEYPWDIGVMPETATQDGGGRPRGGDDATFFSRGADAMDVFGPAGSDGRGRGPARTFNPFTDARSAQMVLEKLGKPALIFDVVRDAVKE